MHEDLLLLSEIPKIYVVLTNTPNLVFLLVTPFKLANVVLLTILKKTLGQITDVPYLYYLVLSPTCEDMAIQGRKLNWVNWASIILHVIDRIHSVTGIPKYSLSLVVTGSKDAIMEFIKTNVLNLFIVEVEECQRADLIVFLSASDVPNGEFAIIASSNNLPLFVRTPLERITFCLMARQNH